MDSLLGFFVAEITAQIRRIAFEELLGTAPISTPDNSSGLRCSAAGKIICAGTKLLVVDPTRLASGAGSASRTTVSAAPISRLAQPVACVASSFNPSSCIAIPWHPAAALPVCWPLMQFVAAQSGAQIGATSIARTVTNASAASHRLLPLGNRPFFLMQSLRYAAAQTPSTERAALALAHLT
jgi:hypothetical protein